MPINLRAFLPASVTDEEVAVFFGNSKQNSLASSTYPSSRDLPSGIAVVSIKEYPFDSEIRQGAIRAYEKVDCCRFCLQRSIS